MSEQVTVPPTIEELTQRAHLLGKMQTSLMRDGWGIAAVNAKDGSLEVVDAGGSGAMLRFTVSLSVPVVEQPAPAPAKATRSPKKRTR